MSTENVRTINCPSCGGPIPPFTGAQTRCPFCGTTVERPAAEKPVTHIAVPVRVPAQPAARPRGCVSPLIVGLAILLLAGGVLVFMLVPNKSTTPNFIVSMSRSVQGAVIPVPVDRAGPADLLVFTYDSSSEERYLTYVDGANRALRWDSPPVSTDVYAAGVVVRNQKVFLVDGARLLALDGADGKAAWQINLSDTVANYCEGCLQVLGGYAVVLSQDGVLQAFEAESGRPAWSERLNETPRNLWTINDQVAVVDYGQPNDPYSVVLQLRDPATGKVSQSLPGTCQAEYHGSNLPIYDPNILLDPAGGAVYLLYGLLPACAQRWDLAAGRMDWQLLAEDHYFDRFNAPLLLAGGKIYGSYGGRVVALDGETGALELLADEQDYELAVQGERDGTLVVLAQRRRGSARYELWGLDADSGQVPWTYIPQDEEPVEAPGGWAADKAFAWHLAPEGLVVLHLNAEPPTLVVGTIDLATGRETPLGTAGLDDDYWAGLAWSDTTAWLTIRKVYAIDLVEGKVVSTWP
jgi:hypothetical protein